MYLFSTTNHTDFKVFIYATGTYGIVALDDITIVPVPTECASEFRIFRTYVSQKILTKFF